MGRFLLIWLCIGPPLLIGTGVVSIGLLRSIDLRLPGYLLVLLLPLVQAAVVHWVIRPAVPPGQVRRWLVALADVRVLIPLGGALLALATGAGLIEQPAAAGGALALAIRVLAAAAGLLLLWYVQTWSGSWADRALLGTLVLVLGAVAADPALTWLTWLGERLRLPLPGLLGGALVLGLTLPLWARLATLLGRQVPATSPWIGAGGLTLFLTAHGAAVNLHFTGTPAWLIWLLSGGLVLALALLTAGLLRSLGRRGCS